MSPLSLGGVPARMVQGSPEAASGSALLTWGGRNGHHGAGGLGRRRSVSLHVVGSAGMGALFGGNDAAHLARWAAGAIGQSPRAAAAHATTGAAGAAGAGAAGAAGKAGVHPDKVTTPPAGFDEYGKTPNFGPSAPSDEASGAPCEDPRVGRLQFDFGRPSQCCSPGTILHAAAAGAAGRGGRGRGRNARARAATMPNPLAPRISPRKLAVYPASTVPVLTGALTTTEADAAQLVDSWLNVDADGSCSD